MSANPRTPPPQQPPPAQKLRIRYTKVGRLRFASHRDFSRAFERALRRAGIPVAFSSGFHPHPRISYANAAPTGAETDAEYLEIGLADSCDPERVRLALNSALPDGFAVAAVVESAASSFTDLLPASRWRLTVVGIPRPTLQAAVDALLAADAVLVERETRSGRRTFDARAAIVSLRTLDDTTVELVSWQTTPLVRPDDVVQALGKVCPDFQPSQPVLAHRLAQGALLEGEVVNPF